MSAHRWSKFWWQDWRSDPALHSCGLAARGLWIEMLCIANDAIPRGYVTINGTAPTIKRLAMMVGASEKQVATLLSELEGAGVFSRTEEGTIYSRRMVRDAELSETGRASVEKRWGKTDSEPNREPNRVATLEPTEEPNGETDSPPIALEARSKKQERKNNNLSYLNRVANIVPTEGAQPVEMSWPPDPHPSAITSRVQQVAIKLGIRQQRAEPATPARTVEEQLAMLRLTQSPTP